MSSVALARVYQQSFEHHPYGTLAVTNGALSALGDIVAQFTEKFTRPRVDRWRYDVPRTMRFFAFGFGMGPLIGRWNFALERNFPLRFQGPAPGGGRPVSSSSRPVSSSTSSGPVSVRALSKRVAADQLVMAPIGLALFLGSMGVMEGRDGSHIRRKYADLLVPALVANWQVWPLAQLINFRYMPIAYRVPFQSTCGVFWTLYLSILNSRESLEQQVEDATHKTLQ